MLGRRRRRGWFFSFSFLNLTAASREFRYKKRWEIAMTTMILRGQRKEETLLKYFLYGKWIFFHVCARLVTPFPVSLLTRFSPLLIISRHAIEFENAFASQGGKKKVHFHFGASRDFYVNPWLSLIKASLTPVYTTITFIRNNCVFTAEISTVFSSSVKKNTSKPSLVFPELFEQILRACCGHSKSKPCNLCKWLEEEEKKRSIFPEGKIKANSGFFLDRPTAAIFTSSIW